MVLTPDGRLSRYFYGIEYAPRDLRLALVEAAAGRIGTPVDQVLLLCFHYDPRPAVRPRDHARAALGGVADGAGARRLRLRHAAARARAGAHRRRGARSAGGGSG